MAIVFVVGGVLLLSLLALDVFLTVFSVEGTGGPVTMRQARLIWSAFRAVGLGRAGKLRESVLALGGPTIVVANFMTWVALILFGYALIYLPFLGTFHFTTGQPRIPFWEAVYFSGQAAATLGTGDMVPGTQLLRLVEVFEAISGFALVTSGLTYLLAVYEELLSMHTTAAMISNYFGGGLTRTLQRVEVTGGDEVGRWSETIGGNVLRALEAHYQYPIVHYFRVRARNRAFSVQMGRLLDLERAVEEGRPTPEVARDIRCHPAYDALMQSLRQYLHEVEQHFVPARFAPGLTEEEEDEPARRYARLLLYLRYNEAADARRPGIEEEAES